MKYPEFDWIPFDKNNPPSNINPDGTYLVIVREDDYDGGKTWHYSVDLATPYGSYIDDFWDTQNDWCEGQRVEVMAYVELAYGYFTETSDPKCPE